MAQKPVVLPDVFTGEKNWDEWIDHFDSVAAVNGWEAAAKLQWLRVCLTGRAAKTFRRLPQAKRANFKLATEALQKSFGPESKKELHTTAMQTPSRKSKEDWAVFGEDLKHLAYPDLQEDARERLALNHYLSHLDDPRLGFSVGQSKPISVNEAVTTTLEMETYLQASTPAMPIQIAQINAEVGEPPATIGGVSGKKQDDPLQQRLQRMERLEVEMKSMRH